MNYKRLWTSLHLNIDKLAEKVEEHEEASEETKAIILRTFETIKKMTDVMEEEFG